MRHVRNIIYRGCTFRVNLALSELPAFAGQKDVAQLGGRIRVSSSLDYLERGYDAAKYGRCSDQPYLEIAIPTLHDATLAPAGMGDVRPHIMTVTAQYAPYSLREGDWSGEGPKFTERILDALENVAPGTQARIRHCQTIAPADWEREYSLTEGSIHHGQMGLDQMLVMRPIPGWGRYETPVKNLYLCGAGAHPGGGVTGAPGYNAARAVLAAR
jgi:phytoene dehydrogenase-like protein